MTDALTLQDLHFGYGRRRTVRGVSLRLSPGDCYGFLGHNGAGKTTVMRLALGLLRPTRGSIRVFGLDARRERRNALSSIGAMIERPGFHLHVTAWQNLVALARLQGITRLLAKAEADRVLEATGLAEAAHRRVGTFSMGMRQRLGIAQALLGGPRLLLLDEPTNGLDPEGIAELRALLLRLTREEGCAVMLSSHQLAELEGLCNRIGVLREGEMVVEGDLDALRRRVAIRHVVIGHPLPVLRQELEQLGLAPTVDGERLLVDLEQHQPAEVARLLANCGALTAFAPEQATLEKIYLQASRQDAADKSPTIAAAAVTEADVEAEADRAAEPRRQPRLGAPANPRRRAFAFEIGTLLRQRTSLPLLLLLPCAFSVLTVRSYARRIDEATALVAAGKRFSADAGSGYLATAQSLQATTPVLLLALLWFASQTIAADLGGDTLRNSLIRSLQRRDVLLGKLGALLTAMLVGWLALIATTVGSAWAMVGFGDLEEVSGYGDRDLLASAAEVWPVLVLALTWLMLPLAAVVAIGVAASAIARRPARALAAALLLVLGPELLRGWLGERAGWLLTSHVPLGLRDDSVLGYAAATARGAADAVWPWADQAVLVPCCWLLVGCGLSALILRSIRVP